MELVVQLRWDAALAWRGHAVESSEELKELDELVRAFGLQLLPAHPHSEDPQLFPFFHVRGIRPSQRVDVALAFRQLEVVRTTYLRPSPPVLL